MDVFAGIESDYLNIAIPIQELFSNGVYKLTLNVKKAEDTAEANHDEVKAEETQMVAVSLPDINTASQMMNAIGGITEPMKRERCSKEEMRRR